MTSPARPPSAITAATCLVTLSLLLAPAPAFACSCLTVGSACAALGRTSAIFIGTAVAVEPPSGGTGSGTAHVRFAIEEAIKGIDATTTTVDVETSGDTGSC